MNDNYLFENNIVKNYACKLKRYLIIFIFLLNK